MKIGSLVVLHLREPSEKFWGRLQHLGPEGVTVRGIQLRAFEDWVREISQVDEPTLGPTTMFVPLTRVESMFLDEAVGAAVSFEQRFESRAGRSVSDFLTL